MKWTITVSEGVNYWLNGTTYRKVVCGKKAENYEAGASLFVEGEKIWIKY